MIILLMTGYLVLIDEQTPSTGNTSVTTNEGSLLVLWSDVLGIDLRVATLAILAILFSGIYATLQLLKEGSS